MKGRHILILFLLLNIVFIEMYAVPPPAELTAGKYAEYEVTFSSSNFVKLSITGTVKFEVEERTSSVMTILVTFSFKNAVSIEAKLRYRIDVNTGNVLSVEVVEGEKKRIPREILATSAAGLWISKDVGVGSVIDLGKGRTATIVGSESVTAKNGVTYDCWKAEATIGGGNIYCYFDKATGLLIKQTMSVSIQQVSISLEIILKDTNIVAAAPGILGILGYISIGGMMIPVLLLVVAIIIIIVVIVLVIVLAKRKKKAPVPPPPPPPPPE